MSYLYIYQKLILPNYLCFWEWGDIISMPEQQAKTGTVSGKPTYIHHFPKKPLRNVRFITTSVGKQACCELVGTTYGVTLCTLGSLSRVSFWAQKLSEVQPGGRVIPYLPELSPSLPGHRRAFIFLPLSKNLSLPGGLSPQDPLSLLRRPSIPQAGSLWWTLFLLQEPLPQLQGGPDSQIQKVSTEFVTSSGQGRLGDTVWKNVFPGVHHVLQSWQDLIIFHLLHWSIVDLQRIHFCSIAKWFSYINTYILHFHILFHWGLSQHVEYSTLLLIPA